MTIFYNYDILRPEYFKNNINLKLKKMRKLRDFFDQSFFVLFFVWGFILIAIYVLRLAIFGDFFANNEMVLFYGFKSFFDLPLTLELPACLNVFDIIFFFFVLIVSKILNDRMEEVYQTRTIKKIYLGVFASFIVGVILNYFFGIFISLIIAGIVAMVISLLISIFVNKNSLGQVDLIFDIIGPFTLFNIAMIIGIGLIHGLSISLFLVTLFFIGVFTLLILFIIPILIILWSIEGVKQLAKLIRSRKDQKK